MEYVLSASEMKSCDTAAIEKYGIASMVLMERAALETARIIIDRYGSGIYAGIIAGSGNNGGDGIAIARILAERGVSVEINLVGDEEKLTAETKVQLDTAKLLGIPVKQGLEHAGYDVIVDALFGIGLARNIEGRYKSAVDMINASNAKVVSVDIASGINADTGNIMGCAVKADTTVTFQYRKLGHILADGAEYSGDVICVPIGIPDITVSEGRLGAFTYTDAKIDLKLPQRKPTGNKGTFGKVLLIAGSKNMGGACLLSALSAFRTGAGMVRVFTAAENRDSLLKNIPETIINTYADDGSQRLSETEYGILRDGMEWADVIAAGPGLSTSDKATDIVRFALSAGRKPLVLDADALNIISENNELLSLFEKDSESENDKSQGSDGIRSAVMTPHIGEFARLAKIPVLDIKKDMLTAVRGFTQKYGVTLACKDAHTIVSRLGEREYINSSGNDGMATAGAGDVLTGIIVGLMAQGMSGFEAAVTGVYTHGLAGDIAREKTSGYYMMAQDIIKALKYLQSRYI